MVVPLGWYPYTPYIVGIYWVYPSLGTIPRVQGYHHSPYECSMSNKYNISICCHRSMPMTPALHALHLFSSTHISLSYVQKPAPIHQKKKTHIYNPKINIKTTSHFQTLPNPALPNIKLMANQPTPPGPRTPRNERRVVHSRPYQGKPISFHKP